MSLWYGSQATVEIGDAIPDIASDSSLDSQLSTSTDYSAQVKEVTFGGGEASVDVLNVFGSQLKEESRPELKTAEFTLTFEDVDALEEFFGDTTAVDTTNYYRINGEDKTGNRENRAILFKLGNANGDVVNVLLNNAWFSTPGEISLAADGSAELSMECSCKISDFYSEDNIS